MEWCIESEFRFMRTVWAREFVGIGSKLMRLALVPLGMGVE